MNKGKKRALLVVQNGLLAIYAIFALFPLLWMLILSFKADTEMFTTTFVFHPTLNNYTEVLMKTDYFSYMIDSLIVSGGAVIMSRLPTHWPVTISRKKKTSHSRSFPLNLRRKSWLSFRFS